jgi:mannitol-1-phosphate 5-dehydrogenase
MDIDLPRKMGRTFVGFGFGPIQAGLFISEAFAGRNFSRLVVAEIDPALVDAVRSNDGCYHVNVAGADGIHVQHISGVEIYNPNIEQDRTALLAALAEASEISTSLPAVGFYDVGQHSVASLIAGGISRDKAFARIVYAAENNNHAAEILQEKVQAKLAAPLPPTVQFLNTVIGKMSQVVVGTDAIASMGLTPIVPGLDRAFLVEAFNRILISRVRLSNFARGIDVFIEKDDLLPFEEAKLYGHNAIHALLAYLGAAKGYTKMTELKHDAAVMKIAHDAFLNESGAALTKKYAHLKDPLFTEAGYRDYAEDLLERMTNPYLADTIARAGRDPRRKLAYRDRIFGTMDLALSQGIQPKNMALGALAGIAALLKQEDIPGIPKDRSPATLTREEIESILNHLWAQDTGPHADEVISCVCQAAQRLEQL